VLNVMRDTLKYSKWILLFIVVSFVMFYGVDWWNVRDSRDGAADGTWVARVNGKSVDLNAWQAVARQIDERYRQQLGEMYTQFRKQMNVGRISADQLITKQLILDDARRIGLTVTDGELSATITTMPMFQRDGGFIGGEEYVAVIRRGALPPYRSERDFERALREEMLAGKWQSTIAASVVVGKDEIEREFRRRNETAMFEYVALPFDKFGAELTPSDAELEAYYGANTSKFGTGEGRRVLYVLFDDKAAEAQVTVGDDEIRTYYEQNKAQFMLPEQRQARHILIKVAPDAPAPAIEAARSKAQSLVDQAKAGADFSRLASQFSEDEGSKGQGGDLGLFPRGRMVPEFEEAVFGNAPGTIAGPVRSSFGFHVIKVEQAQAAGDQPLEAVKDQIRGTLRFPKLRDAATKMAQEFKAKVKTEADLRKVAGDMKLDVKDAGVIMQGEPVPGLGPVPPLTDAAFATGKGQASDVVQLARGAVVLAVQEILPDYTPPFVSRKDRVLAEYRSERAKDQARGRLAAALARAGGDLAKAAADLKAELKTTAPAYTRGSFLPGAGASPDLDELAFSAPLGVPSRAVATDQAAVVIRVSGRSQANMANLARDEAAIRDALRAPRAESLLQKKLEDLRKSARIEYNDALLREEA
jgi:peptidyl-prolyl cis-trans isomerase D